VDVHHVKFPVSSSLLPLLLRHRYGPTSSFYSSFPLRLQLRHDPSPTTPAKLIMLWTSRGRIYLARLVSRPEKGVNGIKFSIAVEWLGDGEGSYLSGTARLAS
jgi:hypothetical protein